MRLFSVVIPWKQRPELRRTLEANRAIFARYSAEVVVVNCGGDPAELAELIGDGMGLDIRHIVLPTPVFNLSLARNIGSSFSSGRHLLFLDSDVILKSDVFAEAIEAIHRHPCIIKIRRIQESTPVPQALSFPTEEVVTREVACADGRRARLQFFTWNDGSRCAPGLILVDKVHLLQVGGFNSRLIGWGFEDIDFQLRVQFVANLQLVALGEAEHLTHSDATRDIRGGSRGMDHRRNMRACFDNYSKAMFDGTYAADEKFWGPRLSERPSRASQTGTAGVTQMENTAR